MSKLCVSKGLEVDQNRLLEEDIAQSKFLDRRKEVDRSRVIKEAITQSKLGDRSKLDLL